MPSNEAVRAAVEAGAGASVLSRSVVASFRVLRHKERYRTMAGEALLALIGEAAP